MPIVTFRVDPDLLRQALHFPYDVEVVGAKWHSSPDHAGQLELMVRSDSAPGPDWTEVTPVFRKQEPIVFVGWK